MIPIHPREHEHSSSSPEFSQETYKDRTGVPVCKLFELEYQRWPPRRIKIGCMSRELARDRSNSRDRLYITKKHPPLAQRCVGVSEGEGTHVAPSGRTILTSALSITAPGMIVMTGT